MGFLMHILRKNSFFCAMLAVLVASCTGLRLENRLKVNGSDWPTFGRQNSHPNATPEILVPPLVVEWEHDITGGIGSGSPLLVDSILLVGNLRGELYAIHAYTGKRKGWVDLGDAIEGSPVVDDNVVFAAASNTEQSLVAYDIVEGHFRWRRTYGDIVVSPILYNQRLYFGTTGGEFYCIDRDGELVWKFSIPENIRRKGIRSSPAADQGNIVFGADDGKIYCLDAVSGKPRWEYHSHAPIAAPPVIVDGRVFVGNLDGDFYSVNLADGVLAWKAEAGGAIYACATVLDGSILVGTTGGFVLCWERQAGTQRWRTNVGGVVDAGAVASGRNIYVGTLKKDLLALDGASGSILWSTTLDGRIKTSPIIGRGRLFVATDEKMIVSLTQVRR